MANALIVPMAFLSGVFMPLIHMNDGMVDFLVRGQGPEPLVLPCAVLLALTLV